MSKNNWDNASIHIGHNGRSCPKCGGALKVVTNEKTVSANNLVNSREFMSLHNMKAYQTRFICPICRLKYTDKDLRRIEKQYKDKNR